MRLRDAAALLVVLASLASAQPSSAAALLLAGQPAVSAEALLLRPDRTEIEVAEDPAYGPGPHRYAVVPIAPLARKLGVTEAGVLVARAADGFVTHIPGALALQEAPGGPRGWLAIEPPGQPWPPLPGKAASAGPFYVVWQPAGAAVSGEYWAYQVSALEATQAPADRWPKLNVAASLPADAPERRGQAVYVATCLPCHRLGGAGEAEVGPDLNTPMNPTRYFQRPALLRYVRNPASVRTWPEQRMPPLPADTLPDADIEAVVRYLEHMADR